MTTYRKGDVVLVPFDFTDRSGSKWRPAVVISSDRYNRETPDVLIASITGNLNAIPHPGDWRIGAWQAAGLLRSCLIFNSGHRGLTIVSMAELLALPFWSGPCCVWGREVHDGDTSTLSIGRA